MPNKTDYTLSLNLLYFIHCPLLYNCLICAPPHKFGFLVNRLCHVARCFYKIKVYLDTTDVVQLHQGAQQYSKPSFLPRPGAPKISLAREYRIVPTCSPWASEDATNTTNTTWQLVHARYPAQPAILDLIWRTICVVISLFHTYIHMYINFINVSSDI